MRGGQKLLVPLDGIPTLVQSLGSGANPIVLFPALMDSANAFGRLQMLLSRRLPQCTIVAVQPPGYGEGELGPVPDFQRWSSWVQALTQYVQLTWPGPSTWLGNSSGAVAATMAARSATGQSRLVLLGWCDWRAGSPPSGAELCPDSVEGVQALLARAWHVPPDVSPSTVQRLLAAARRNRAHVSSFARQAYQRELGLFRGKLALLRGASDGLVSDLDVQATARFMPRAKVITLPACGHYPQREQPAELARVLVRLDSQWVDAPSRTREEADGAATDRRAGTAVHCD